MGNVHHTSRRPEGCGALHAWIWPGESIHVRSHCTVKHLGMSDSLIDPDLIILSGDFIFKSAKLLVVYSVRLQRICSTDLKG